MPAPAVLLVIFLSLAGVVDVVRLAAVGERVRDAMPGITDIDLPKPRPKPKGEAVKVSMMALKNAKYRRGRPLEDWVQDLDGETVVLSGYMALGTLEGLTKFELVPESCECGKSKVNHFVEVTLTDDVTRFKPGRFAITGVFEASEQYEDGFCTSVYRLIAEEIP